MTEPDALPPRPANVRRASLLLAAGTTVSRILGFVSAAVLAWTIGLNNASANAFAIANTLPNNILLLIAGGFLSAVLVPQIVKAGLHSDGGQRFINRLVTLGTVVFLAVTVLATLGAPLLVGVYTFADDALDSSGTALAVVLAYWCLPQIFFYALYSLLSEVLNARGKRPANRRGCGAADGGEGAATGARTCVVVQPGRERRERAAHSRRGGEHDAERSHRLGRIILKTTERR